LREQSFKKVLAVPGTVCVVPFAPGHSIESAVGKGVETEVADTVADDVVVVGARLETVLV
jgi:hypothetical protein